jgi:hypothetical protein
MKATATGNAAHDATAAPAATQPEIAHYPAGRSATNPQIGDFVLTGIKSQGIVSLAIKLGALLRGFPKEYRRFSHSALIVGEDGAIVEAVSSGVKRNNLSKYEPADYVLVRTKVDHHDAVQVLAFADAVVQAREKYGFLTFVGLAIYCLTGTRLCIQTAGTAICSGFVCDALTRAGFIWPRPPYVMMPADLARYFTELRDRAAAMDGELLVDSPPGQGTVVAETLPIAA